MIVWKELLEFIKYLQIISITSIAIQTPEKYPQLTQEIRMN